MANTMVRDARGLAQVKCADIVAEYALKHSGPCPSEIELRRLGFLKPFHNPRVRVSVRWTCMGGGRLEVDVRDGTNLTGLCLGCVREIASYDCSPQWRR